MSILRLTPNRSVVIDLRENDSFDMYVELRLPSATQNYQRESHHIVLRTNNGKLEITQRKIDK